MKYLPMFCAALLAGTTLMAQQRTEPERTRPRDPRSQERARPARPDPERPGALTAEERAKVQEVLGKTREEQRTFAEKIRTIREEMEQLVRAENVDEAAVRAKAAELGEAEAGLALIRGRQYRELKGVLTEEQLNSLQRPAMAPGSQGAFGQRLERAVRRPGTPPEGKKATPRRPVPPRRGAADDNGGE